MLASSCTKPTAAAGLRRPYRIAVLGAGWISREVWLPLLAEHPAFEVGVVLDADRSLASAVAPGDGTAQITDDLAEVDTDLLDAAVIALPNDLHVPMAQQLLRAGVPVFVEKPVCRTVAEGQALAATEQAGQAEVYSWSAARQRGDVQRLAELLPSLGTIRAVELSWARAAGIPQRAGWFLDRQRAGGGALMDLGWHLLDVGLDLLGWPQVLGVQAVTSADFFNRQASAADWRAPVGSVAKLKPTALLQPGDRSSVEDTARGLLVTDTGVGISLETRWASHEPTDVTTITVEGTAGLARLSCTFGFSPHRVLSSLTVLRAGQVEQIPLAAEPVGTEYRRQVDRLAEVLGQGQPTPEPATLTRALAIADCIERLYCSADLVPDDDGATERQTRYPEGSLQ